MWRTAICAVGGLSAACAAIYVSTSFTATADASTFEARWQAVGAAAKADRLLPPRAGGDRTLVTVSVPAAQTSVVMKQARKTDDAALLLRVQPIRVVPIVPSKSTPKRDAGHKDELPVGCEPSFSPVTMPSMAHVSGRCLS
jgi:hypothetical protein